MKVFLSLHKLIPKNNIFAQDSAVWGVYKDCYNRFSDALSKHSTRKWRHLLAWYLRHNDLWPLVTLKGPTQGHSVFKGLCFRNRSDIDIWLVWATISLDMFVRDHMYHILDLRIVSNLIYMYWPVSYRTIGPIFLKIASFHIYCSFQILFLKKRNWQLSLEIKYSWNIVKYTLLYCLVQN